MNISPNLVGPFIGGLYSLWCATLRYTEVNREAAARIQAETPLVFALWHDELFAVPYKRNGWPIFTIVSRSRDGEYLSRVLASQGLGTVRGSSSRGGLAALLRAAKLMQEERQHACITIDGPRGPRHEVKDGAIFLAHRVSSYIVPARVYYAKAKVFRSWDKFQLPWPFSRVHIQYGDPYRVAEGELTAEVLERERQILKEKLERLTLPAGAFS